jgi:hypothetical protein
MLFSGRFFAQSGGSHTHANLVLVPKEICDFIASIFTGPSDLMYSRTA